MDIWKLYQTLGNETPDQLGSQLFIAEQAALDGISWFCRGFYGVQLGYLGTHNLLATPFHQRSMVIAEHMLPQVQLVTDFQSLPFRDNSVDVVLAPHVLEFHPQPLAVLNEISRVLTSSGSLILFCFNSLSLWGLRHYATRLFSQQKGLIPWNGRFYSHTQLRQLLGHTDLTVMATYNIFYRPASQYLGGLKRWHFLEMMGRLFWPGVGASCLYCVSKQTLAMTPLRLRFEKPEASAIEQAASRVQSEVSNP